jgi:hypothetical protein
MAPASITRERTSTQTKEAARKFIGCQERRLAAKQTVPP